ncbi:MAG: DUF1232 domain-containing protein [Lachnospiraceae bacterium]|nr:DUF1232 domain-containing protein [Lachnospiraceae bacterium]
MDTAEKIEKLMQLAAEDPALRTKLLGTREEDNSISSFCAAAREAGIELYEMELVSFGEEEHAAMKRSTNGGGENTPKLEWQDDYYEILMTELEMNTGNSERAEAQNLQNTEAQNAQNTETQNSQNTETQNSQNTETQNSQNTETQNSQTTDTMDSQKGGKKMSDFNAQEILENGMNKAEELLQDPSAMDDLLVKMENSVSDIPVAGSVLAQIPLMISMVKGYIQKTYTEVSPKVILTMVSAFIYIVKRNDLIPDKIPVIGKLDDIAVITLALKFVEPELEAFKTWRDGQKA